MSRKKRLHPPPRMWLEDAAAGEVLRVVCGGCGIRSDLLRLPAPIPAILALLTGFERGHAGCREEEVP